MPAVQHRAIRTWARTTNHPERFNTALRQRVSPLVREALSSSKNPAHHSGAITRFIGHDTLTRAAASREHDRECTTVSRAPLYEAMTPSPQASVWTGARVRVSADSASARWSVDTRAAEETRSRLVVTGADHCAAAVAPLM